MNKRIWELANQCQEYRSGFDGQEDWHTVFNKQKFAELLIRECMTTILKESKWYWDKDEFESSSAIQNAARRVKEHFGVEE